MLYSNARSIINHCQGQGAYLRKCFLAYSSGNAEVAYFLEPQGRRVPAKDAEEAISSGLLIKRDRGLFDGCPQTYVYCTYGSIHAKNH